MEGDFWTKLTPHNRNLDRSDEKGTMQAMEVEGEILEINYATTHVMCGRRSRLLAGSK